MSVTQVVFLISQVLDLLRKGVVVSGGPFSGPLLGRPDLNSEETVTSWRDSEPKEYYSKY